MNDLISRKELWQKTFICDEVAEVRKFIEQAPAVNPLPCKIGDKVWAIRFPAGKPIIKQYVVSEMAYLEDMRLGIAVRTGKISARGFWGETIFATREDAEAAIGGKDNERKAD